MVGVESEIPDRSQVLRSLRQDRDRFVLVGLVGASLVIGLLITVIKLALEPLAPLQRAASTVAIGELDEPVAIRSDDESGNVAQSFAQMLACLQEDRQTDLPGR